jgi:glycosyltransferase involved in cell wall biosynthesis
MMQLEELSDSKVSVIIPAYNAERFLSRTIESVLAQTVAPHEIIVVDDGSSDETLKVAQNFGGIVRCLTKPNGGPASARNHGIRVATGDWIAFLDADDQWLPDKLEKQFQLIRKTGADMVSSDATLVGGSSSGTSWMRHAGLWPRLHPFLGERIISNSFEMLLTIGCFLLPSMVLVKKSSLLDAGLFDEGMHGTEDIDLWLRLALRCKIAIHPSTLITRQIHSSNVTGNAGRMVAEKIKVWEKVQDQEAVMRNPAWAKLVKKRKAVDYRHLGYWLLHEHKLIEARQSWRKSLRSSFSLPVAAFWLVTFLPSSVVSCLQKVRRRLRSACSRIANGRWEHSTELKGRSH